MSYIHDYSVLVNSKSQVETKTHFINSIVNYPTINCVVLQLKLFRYYFN